MKSWSTNVSISWGEMLLNGVCVHRILYGLVCQGIRFAGITGSNAQNGALRRNSRFVIPNYEKSVRLALHRQDQVMLMPAVAC